MRTKIVALALVLLFCSMALWGGVSVTHAAGKSFQVLSVTTTGCNSGEFGMSVQLGNFDGGTYNVRTVVTVAGLVYMNENATLSGYTGDVVRDWHIFNNFSYGSVSNMGTYPIPSGELMWLNFSLERPVGTVLYTWTLIVDGCDTGVIQSNGPGTAPAAGCDTLTIPATAVGATITADTHVYWAPGEASEEVFPAGLTLRALGVNSTGAFTKVLFACGYYWVPTSVIGPNYDQVWNGAPLPTGVVQ